MEYLKPYLDSFFSMGVYAYFVIGFILVSGIFAVVSMKFQKNAKEKWLAAHPGATKIDLETGTNLITVKELTAQVVSGEAALFLEKGHYAVWSMPGETILEVTYTYTRPGVLYKNVSTTWGPAKVSLTIESGKEYVLRFDKKQEEFILEER